MPNSRTFKIRAKIDEQEITKPYPWLTPDRIQQIVRVESTGTDKNGAGVNTSETGAACQRINAITQQYKYWDAWQSGQEATFELYSAKDGWQSPDPSKEKRQYCAITISHAFDMGRGTVGENAFVKKVTVYTRCDSASYLWSSGGCVFAGITPVLHVRHGVGYDTQWSHLKFARDHQNATYPQLGLPKTIPGFSKTSLITRCAYDSICGKKGTNRREARKACRAWFGRDYSKKYSAPPGGVQEDPSRPDEPDGILDDGIVDYPGVQGDCDEYPFNATYEGSSQASKGKYNFSVYVISGPENQYAGNQMNMWANRERLVDGDKYWINVEN